MTSRIPELCKPWVLTQQVQNHNQWSVTARSQHWGKDSAGRLENWRKKEYLDVLTWTRSSRTSFVASNTKTLGFSRCPCDTPCSRVGWTSWAGLCIVCASFVSVQCTCCKINHEKFVYLLCNTIQLTVFNHIPQYNRKYWIITLLQMVMKINLFSTMVNLAQTDCFPHRGEH